MATIVPTYLVLKYTQTGNIFLSGVEYFSPEQVLSQPDGLFILNNINIIHIFIYKCSLYQDIATVQNYNSSDTARSLL
jgi:hypothetical protein